MARDHWVEILRCRNCRRRGYASLSATDRLSWDAQVDSVPEGFKAIDTPNGTNFYCECHVDWRGAPETHMPLGKKKLSTCDRDAIRAWIREGAKNN